VSDKIDKPERIRAAILEVVKTQIREGTPPETQESHARLKSEGYSEEEVMKYLGSVVTTEIFEVLEKGRPYNHENYVKALKALPNGTSEDFFSN